MIAWTAQPSAHVVAAETAADVAASVNFARDHNLRLVIRGGHSYLAGAPAETLAPPPPPR
jgi:FAD/FMN-containing dehydrogenase